MKEAESVARELLGKIIVVGDKKAKIVETEVYYDEKDPASRACQNGDLRETMKMLGGTILVYGVHNNWLINFVTGDRGKAEAVLLRAIEPINFQVNTKGPGLLTKALGIDKSFHKENVLNSEKIKIVDFQNFDNKNFNGKNLNLGKIEIIESFRIGIKKDLPKKLRFYIKNNEFISKK